MGFAERAPSAGIIPSVFVDAETGSILWGRLATTIVGGTWLAVFTGAIRFILGAFREVAGLYEALGGFLAALVEVLLGAPTSVIETSYGELEAFIGTLGPGGYVGAVVSVLIITYISTWVVNNA